MLNNQDNIKLIDRVGWLSNWRQPDSPQRASGAFAEIWPRKNGIFASLIYDLSAGTKKCINTLSYQVIAFHENSQQSAGGDTDHQSEGAIFSRILFIRNMRANIDSYFDPFFVPNDKNSTAARFMLDFFGKPADLRQEDIIWSRVIRKLEHDHITWPQGLQGIRTDDRLTIIFTPVYEHSTLNTFSRYRSSATLSIAQEADGALRMVGVGTAGTTDPRDNLTQWICQREIMIDGTVVQT